MKLFATAKRLATGLLIVLLVGLFAPAALAQETTGGLQGVVKDPSGAVVAKATVVATSPALIGQKTVVTDSGGYYRFANLPPGTYSVTVTAPNFRTFKRQGIVIETGHLPTLDIALQVGSTSETVEVSSEAPLVDVTQSKVQTNITSDMIQDIPTGRSFQSVIALAPGARDEPLQGGSTGQNGSTSPFGSNGFQIDGASNSENAYLVDGQDTGSVFDGHSAVNVPMEFIKEVQVKTSGFEAEYGGALGGVVNVVPQSGSNAYHGSVFMHYQGDSFDAAPNRTLERDPLVGANAGGATRLDQPAIYYQPAKDHYRFVTPGFTLGGPILKNRLWFFASTAPEFDSWARTVKFASTAPIPGARTFHENVDTYYSMARLDFLATNKIRLFGAWSYSYARGTGTSLPQADSAYAATNPSDATYNSASSNNVDNFNNGIGYVAPNVVYNLGADITLTNNLVATTRFGYFFQNYEDRGIPTGVRYIYEDSNYPNSTGDAPASASTTSLNGQTLPAQFVNNTGWSNIGSNYGTKYDMWKRYSLNQDLAYFKKGWGIHNFKFGYAFNHGWNDIVSGYLDSRTMIAYNIPYSPLTSTGITNCQAIVAQNQANYGAPGGNADGSSCMGNWGTVDIFEYGTTGKVGGWNHSLYAQDAWTVGRGITLNIGVRADKESLPSYNTLPGYKGISWGWGSKVAPRLGASWDVLGTGKLKLYGSFGYFYDIMKYQLPRGSFGGDYWHNCIYALDNPDFTQIVPQRDANGHYCPTGGGNTAANLASGASGLRLIENTDFREPANAPNQIGSLGATGLVDPNLKPMKQHEMVIGADWEISPTLAFETRYSRKRLDRTIEDAGTITPDGEVYYITNPGFGVNSVVPGCTGCPPNPKASRRYDGLEFRLTRRGGGRWFGAISYTYSRLYGNYSGLTSTDVSDSIGRNGANTDRAFDEPFMSFDASGHPINGPLATDRPHTLKAYGYYNLKWWKFNDLIGLSQQAYSGTPMSSYISVWGAPVFVAGRGNFVDMTRDPNTGDWSISKIVHGARTPMFSQTDFHWVHEMHVSKTNEAMVAAIEANVSNIFNQHSPVFINQNLIRTGTLGPAGCSGATCTDAASQEAGFSYASIMTKGYDYTALANSSGYILNSMYGMPFGWQNPRSFRFNLRFTF